MTDRCRFEVVAVLWLSGILGVVGQGVVLGLGGLFPCSHTATSAFVLYDAGLFNADYCPLPRCALRVWRWRIGTAGYCRWALAHRRPYSRSVYRRPALAVVDLSRRVPTGSAYIMRCHAHPGESAIPVFSVRHMVPVFGVALGVVILGEPRRCRWFAWRGAGGIVRGSTEGRLPVPEAKQIHSEITDTVPFSR